MIPSRRQQGEPSGSPIPRLVLALALAVPPIGAIADTVAKGLRHSPPVRAVARAPERAILDPNNERNLPLISKAATTAYEEQQSDR